jgi:hypothetical protein
MDSIEKGIVELIAQLGIRNLVMGGAADKHYSRYKPQRNSLFLFLFLLMF